VDDPDTLVAFAKAAFAAKEMKNQHVSGSDGKTIHTAFRIEECIIETGRASGKWKALPGATTCTFVTWTQPTPVP